MPFEATATAVIDPFPSAFAVDTVDEPYPLLESEHNEPPVAQVPLEPLEPQPSPEYEPLDAVPTVRRVTPVSGPVIQTVEAPTQTEKCDIDNETVVLVAAGFGVFAFGFLIGTFCGASFSSRVVEIVQA